MWQADGTKFQDATNYLSVNSFTYPRFSGVQHSSDGQKSPSGGNTECQKQIHFHTLRNMSCSVPKGWSVGICAASALTVIYSCIYMYVVCVAYECGFNMNYVYYLPEWHRRSQSFILLSILFHFTFLSKVLFFFQNWKRTIPGFLDKYRLHISNIFLYSCLSLITFLSFLLFFLEAHPLLSPFICLPAHPLLSMCLPHQWLITLICGRTLALTALKKQLVGRAWLVRGRMDDDNSALSPCVLFFRLRWK